MYVRYSGRHLFFLFRHVLLFMEREGASPRLPPVDLPSHTMQPKTADPLRAGISRALHIPLGQIKPATCCSIKSSSLMSHRLIMSLWDRGREKKGRRTSPSRLSWWKQFFCEAFQSSLRVRRLRLSFNLINFHLWPFEFLFSTKK
jgi:hypothetical protein